MNAMLKAALRYAELGYQVFPCVAGDKRPLTEHGFHDSTADMTQIKAWWAKHPDANVAIPTEGLAVIDVDGPGNPWPGNGDRAVDLSRGPMSLTPRGGRHHIFRQPTGKAWRNTAGTLAPRVDTRADGGYIVVPPSVVAGKPYSWAQARELATGPEQLAEPPEWLTGLLDGLNGNGGRPDAHRAPDGVDLPATGNLIRGGQRNATLARLAGNMRRVGMTQAEILAALERTNQDRCRPPLDSGEVERIATSIARYAPDQVAVAVAENHWAQNAAANGNDPADYHLSDSGNAGLFAELHGQNVRFDFRRAQWLVWTGHHWGRDDDGKLIRLAQDVARRRYQDAPSIPDREEAKRAAKFALDSENKTRVMAMLDLARSRVPIADSGEDWDPNPMLLGAPNGVVDLRTGDLRAGRRDDRVSLVAGVPYDPGAVCSRWLQFLFEIFDGKEDLIEFVQRAVGYSLTGDVSEQCLFVLHGTGANGKSTFLNAVRHVAGDYGYNMPFSTMELDQRSSVPNDLAALVGRRLVTSSETNEAMRLNEGRVKALTGGDPITARFLHREYFTFRPVATFWLAVNHKPRVTDDSHGFWRRVRLVPFTQQFPGDKHLEAQLNAEAPGILTWAVQGCLAWQQRGLDAPDCVRNATEEYRRESDLLEEFIAEHIEESGSEVVLPIRDIVAAYERWADSEGLRGRERLGSRSLRSRLKSRWPKRHRPAVRSTPARYVGLHLRGSDV